MAKIGRREFVEGSLMAIGGALLPVHSLAFLGKLKFEARDKLNILLITVDDMDWESTGLFNAKNQRLTPNINQLGQEGMSFKHSHVVISECWGSRSAIFSGRLPHRNGTTVFKPIDPDVLVLPEVLQKAGYLTGLAGKLSHSLHNRHSVFDVIFSARDIRQGRCPDCFYSVTKSFLEQAKRDRKPFFLNLNIEDPHRPFAGSPEDRDLSVYLRNKLEKIDPFDLDALKVRPVGKRVFDPEDVFIPGFLPDIPEIRSELATYYSSVARADLSVGRILEALSQSGLESETIVVFLSDNGMDMPFAKANVYPFSTAASLIIRAPSPAAQKGLNEHNFVSSVDLFPTILDLTGIEGVSHLDGNSLVPALNGTTKSQADHCFTYRHEYPMRAMHSQKFSYIYNFWSDGKTSFQPIFLNTPSARAMREYANRDETVAMRQRHHIYRQKEELYDVGHDPYCLVNVAEDPAYVDTLNSMRNAIHKQMHKTDDNLIYQFEKEIVT